MIRFVALGIVVLACVAGCSSQPEAPPPAPPPPVARPPVPPPPVFVDVLPEFKKNARAFLDLAKKLDTLAKTDPPPTYAAFSKEYEDLEPIYAKVFEKEPKEGTGAKAFERINNVRDSLHQTRTHLKNKDNVKPAQLTQLLEAEADKRKLVFDEAEHFWRQTPDFTKRDD